MFKLLLFTVSLFFVFMFSGCYSFHESEVFGKLAIFDAMIDLEYHYSVAGFQKIYKLNYAFIDKKNDISLSEIIGVSVEEQDNPFMDEEYFKTLKPFTLSGMGNLSYNLLYILHLPSKIIHTIHYDATRENSNFFLIIWSVIKNIIYGLWGLLQALIMCIVGTAIGFLVHPINTFTDIYYLTGFSLKAVWYAIKFIFVKY